MSPGRDEDLDWLYGRGPASQPDEPEPTRFLPPTRPPSQPDGATRGRPAQQPSAQQPSAQQPSVQQPSVQGPPTQRMPAQSLPTQRMPAQSLPTQSMPAQRSAEGPPPWAQTVQPARPGTGNGRSGRSGPVRPVPAASPTGPGGPGAAATGGAATGAARARKPRRPVRRILGVLGVLVALCLVWLIGVPIYAWSQVSRVANDPSGSRPADQPGYTFLLLGSDSRAGLTKAQRKALGTGSAAGQRTDTIMLLSVPTVGKPALISIPRDSYVPIPGNGTNKINAAYAFGGPKLITKTVEQNTGLRIDGYVEVGFGGFVNVIDALGGIRLCLPDAIKDKDSHIDLKAGCQTLSGANALGYVRERHADPLGDLGRAKRQRQMLSAMIKKAASPGSVINPVSYWQTSTAGAKSLTLGETTSAWEMLHFLLAMKSISAGNGYTLTVPVSDTNASTPAGSAVLWDSSRAKAMFADLARGDTTDMAKYAK